VKEDQEFAAVAQEEKAQLQVEKARKSAELAREFSSSIETLESRCRADITILKTN